ncbi:MAG TPA: serine/threonine-protein kinase, partial [Thermoanaerobaculia bacterium]
MPQPGTLIEGKYEILGKLREGGMGAIYKVRHRLLDEVRVIKVMRPQILSNEEMKRRFVEEARTATKLKHPNICTIYDFALDEDGTAYLVMEFIDGVTLADLFRTPDPPGLPVTLEVAHQALLALGYLHRRNVVHRDVAPDNLMLTSDEEGRPLIKLIDLGIAKALDSKSGDMTSTGVFLGKLKYASPEQYGALAPGEKIDGRSDLYCLGVVVYELLTGKRPFVGDTPAEMLRSHLFQPPLPFSETDPAGKVPEEVRAAVLKSLEKKREDRFASAEDFDREIERLRKHIAAADDPEATVAFVSTARKSRDIVPGIITPSAQDRLDLRFRAQATPHPSKATAPPGTAPPGAPPPGAAPSDAMDMEKTERSPERTTLPLPARPAPLRGRTIAIGLAVALGILGAV